MIYLWVFLMLFGLVTFVMSMALRLPGSTTVSAVLVVFSAYMANLENFHV